LKREEGSKSRPEGHKRVGGEKERREEKGGEGSGVGEYPLLFVYFRSAVSRGCRMKHLELTDKKIAVKKVLFHGGRR